MKKALLFSSMAISIIIISIIGHLIYLNNLSKADSYPEDTFLLNHANKNALIIVGHDDDAISMSGTVAYLKKNGWEIRELCFYQGYKNTDSIRKKDLMNAAKLLGMNGVEYYDIELRKDRDKIEKPWLPIPYSDFDRAYNKITALNHMEDFIKKYNPSVIFTLDDVIGGYGHPDHVYISKLITYYCTQHQNDSSFSVERIYQAVFDPEMNERILKDMDAFQLAKKVYNVEHSPTPDVYISIQGHEAIKKEAMLAYATEQNSLTKIWPYYNYYPSAIYFKIFDKEYYRVLKIDKN